MTRHAEPHVLYIQARHLLGEPWTEEAFEQLLAVLADITPLVEAVPPSAAFAEVRGSLHYFGRGAAELAAIIRLRALALHSIDCTIGVAAAPQLARMLVHHGPPGAIRTLGADPHATEEFLRPLGPEALPGVGPATARTLAQYGLTTVGRIAATPLGTLQRILGATAGRQLLDRARGIDAHNVTPNAPARSLTSHREFDRDELDPDQHRRALLSVTEELGVRLRSGKQAATALTLTVRYADRSTTTRSSRLYEPTAHTPDLTDIAYALYQRLALQRARVRAVCVRAEGLRDVAGTTRQLALDAADEKRRRLEAAADRARRRFGAHVVRPAALHGTAPPHRKAGPGVAA
jgi:DNA polymerase-4